MNDRERSVCRYLGVRRPENLPKGQEELLRTGLKRAESASGFRWTATVPLELKRGESGLYAGALPLEGKDIAAHLEGCTHALLFGATLGAGVDALLRRTQVLDMAEAVVLDAAANVLIEEYADRAEEELRQTMRGAGFFMTGRFSPGYGDFPISVQRELIRLLDGPGKIGLTVGESFLMSPHKSITAVLGLADRAVTGKRAGCGTCVMRNKCVYRKRGTTCD